MTEISFVLPFALPPAELAPDLIRALTTPTLANLLTRSASRRHLPVDPAARVLPYESWLAHAYGVPADAGCAFATAVMRGYGLQPGPGTWLIVNPVHIEVARSHLLMHDPRGMQLSEPHARALFDSAQPYFDESGLPLLYGDAGTWFMRADRWSDLTTATPDAALGLNLTDWLPLGARAVEYRKLQNEVQMLWFAHPANAEREARGLAAVNGFWPWGAAGTAVQHNDINLAVSTAPAWLAALATRKNASLPELIGANATHPSTVLVCGELISPALATDWSGWLGAMQHLEQTVFAPALAALQSGAVRQVRLLLSDRTRHLEIVTTNMAQRAFWRKPTLHTLLP